jgi:hypothetical protein
MEHSRTSLPKVQLHLVNGRSLRDYCKKTLQVSNMHSTSGKAAKLDRLQQISPPHKA